MLQLLVQPKTDIPKGSIVELILPTSGEVSFTSAAIATAPDCEIIGLSIPDPVSCKVEATKITWDVNLDIAAFNPFQVKVANGFNNPITSEPTDTFQMNIYTNSGRSTKLDYQDVDLFYTATMATLTSDKAKLVQVADSKGGTGEVSKPTKVQLQLTLGIAMPKDTVITMDFPKFNPQASTSLRKSYFVDD